MSDKKVSFINRFQVVVFNEYVTLEAAFQMTSLNPDGSISGDHVIQNSQYLNMTTTDAKQLAIILVDTIMRQEKNIGAEFSLPKEFQALWDERIKKVE